VLGDHDHDHDHEREHTDVDAGGDGDGPWLAVMCTASGALRIVAVIQLVEPAPALPL
jgi:hypothetical protein